MSTESKILLSNIIGPESLDSSWSYGQKKTGAGYNKISDGLHTVIYEVDSFIGSIKIQGTLATFPGNSDWVDIPASLIEAWNDSTVFQSGSVSRSFYGNFVWIRAAYNLQNGSITSIRYNH